MSDLSQGGTPGVNPASLPADFFVPKPEVKATSVSLPLGTEIVISAKTVEGEGIAFAVTALPGSKINNVDLANALHALSHQIGEAAVKSEAAAKAANESSGE